MLRSSTATRFAAISGLVALACHSDTPATPSRPSLDPAHAIALEIDMREGTVSQVSPGRGGAHLALVGQNEIAAIVTNVRRTTVNTGLLRARVAFDLALTNRMSNVDLVPSTFPPSPTGAVVAFPFSTSPSGLLGLRVRPNDEWDGDPWNFFNDDFCLPIGAPSDCARWEPFGTSIRGGATTAARTVGFDVDASIATFTVYVAVAADLKDRAVPPALAVSENLVQFTAQAGGAAPPAHMVQVTNAGGGSLTGLGVTVSYAAGQPAGWISAILNGTTAPATLSISAGTAGLPIGTYQATATVTSPGAANSPVPIAIVLVVAEPRLAVTPITGVTLNGAFGGGRTAEQQLAVTSTSAVPVTGLGLAIEYGGEGGWLTATLDNTSTPTVVRVTASPGALQPGRYFVGLRVTSPVGSVDRVITVNVELLPDLRLTGTGSLAVTATSVSVSGLSVVNGGYAAAGPFNVAACISPTNSIDGCVVDGGYQIAALPTGATLGISTLHIDLALSTVPITPGVYYVFAIVDPPYTAMAREVDETNNVLPLGTITIPSSLFELSSSTNTPRLLRAAGKH